MENGKVREILRVLINFGAQVDAKNDDGKTPFLVALESHNFAAMKELVMSGADVNLRINENGETYLHTAITNRESDCLINFLIGLGAQVGATDKYGLSGVQKAVLTGDVRLIKLLVESGADMSVRDRNGWSLVHCAAWCAHVEALIWLLKRGADVNSKATNGSTALHFAARLGLTTVVEVLLEHGADPNSKDCSAWTPLRWATYQNQFQVAQLLENSINDKKFLRPFRVCCIL